LFATNAGSISAPATISAFVVNTSTGALSLTSGSPYSVGQTQVQTNIDSFPLMQPDGKFIYVKKDSELKVFGYSIDQTSGALTSLANAPLPYTQFAGRFSPTNKLNYYAPLVLPSTSMSFYEVDNLTGVGTQKQSPATSQSVQSPNFDASGKYLYAASAARFIFGYSINATTGFLTALPNSPYPWPQAQTGAVSNFQAQVVVHPSGKFVYVLDPNLNNGTPLGDSNITTYAIDQSTGSLSAVGSAIPTGGTAGTGMQIYKNGQFLLVTNRGTASVAIYGINLTTGALTPVVGSPFDTLGTAPGFVVIDPSGKFAYLTDAASNTIREFTIDATAGTITVGPSYPTGQSPSVFPQIVGLQ
jgi:6-phosphogluconolactonase (cycloisomerase 2 family)